ncbi:CooT family nickel-binding protein [Chloroflexota bacterium]
MCLSKVYNKKNGDQELLMEEVASVEIGDNHLTFRTLFGEQKEIEGSIKQIDFLTHSILLENAETS